MPALMGLRLHTSRGKTDNKEKPPGELPSTGKSGKAEDEAVGKG